MNKFFILFIAACLALVSCTEGNTGSSISAVHVEIYKDSSFVITGKSLKVGKIPSRTTTQLLGKLKAEHYGELSSEIVTQFMPAYNIDTVGVTAEQIDSAILFLRIPNGGYFGDSIMPMRVSAYKLTKPLPSPIYSNFDVSEYKGDYIGSASYTASALKLDSLEDLGYREVGIKLPDAMAKDLFNEYKRNPSTYDNPDAFLSYLPGVYVTTSYGNGRVMSIEKTTVDVYYRKREAISEEKDTVYNLYSSYLGTTPEVVTNNIITMNTASDIAADIEAGAVVLQAPAGYDAEITIPGKEILKKIVDYIEVENVIGVLNETYLEIPVTIIENDYGIKPPKYLLFVKEDKLDEFFEEKKINDDINSFYAAYSSTSHSYIFSEMRRYILDLFDRYNIEDANSMDEMRRIIDNIPDEEFRFIATPVNIETETDNYYGTTMVTRITPDITAPSIVKLDLNKAKLRITLSRQRVLF